MYSTKTWSHPDNSASYWHWVWIRFRIYQQSQCCTTTATWYQSPSTGLCLYFWCCNQYTQTYLYFQCLCWTISQLLERCDIQSVNATTPGWYHAICDPCPIYCHLYYSQYPEILHFQAHSNQLLLCHGPWLPLWYHVPRWLHWILCCYSRLSNLSWCLFSSSQHFYITSWYVCFCMFLCQSTYFCFQHLLRLPAIRKASSNILNTLLPQSWKSENLDQVAVSHLLRQTHHCNSITEPCIIYIIYNFYM